MDYERRRDRLRRKVKAAKADAILVTNFDNVTYLTGFTGDDSYLLVHGDGELMLSDFRYVEQLEEECAELELVLRGPGSHVMDLVEKVVRKAKINTLAIEADSITLSRFQQIEKQLGKICLTPSQGIVESLREIKDADELACLQFAIDVAERAFSVIRAGLRPEQSEQEVAFALEQQIRLFGGTGCSFDPIVAVGPRAALPHATPTARKIGASDFVLIDWGATVRGYRSDLTRVLVTGRISPKLERIYGVVLRAQLAAIKAIRPGALMKDVDAAARSVIAEAGYAKKFGHGLGHGIGLEIHESPRLASNNHRPLRPGMVITIEPGIYLPQWGGVRIEDDILVTRNGHRVLTSVTKDLADCVIP